MCGVGLVVARPSEWPFTLGQVLWEPPNMGVEYGSSVDPDPDAVESRTTAAPAREGVATIVAEYVIRSAAGIWFLRFSMVRDRGTDVSHVVACP